MSTERRDLSQIGEKTRGRPLAPGELAPWFVAPVLDGSERYAFDTVAGRAVLLLFFGTAVNPDAAAALRQVAVMRSLLDDVHACFFGVTIDPKDAKEERIRSQIPGIRFVLDFDRAVSRSFGAWREEDRRYLGHWLVLDRTLRVVGAFPLAEAAAAFAALERLIGTPPAPDWAPVAMVSDVLEPELCARLIQLYEAEGGEDSGFMRDVGGRTRLLLDPAMKVRRDLSIEDPALTKQLDSRLEMAAMSPTLGRLGLLATLGLAACAAPRATEPPVAASAPASAVAAATSEGVIGSTASALVARFGEAALDVREGPARKLQFSGRDCILDAYLYPPRANVEPVVAHADARQPNGSEMDRDSCVAALSGPQPPE